MTDDLLEAEPAIPEWTPPPSEPPRRTPIIPIVIVAIVLLGLIGAVLAAATGSSSSSSHVKVSAQDVGPFVMDAQNPADPHNADTHWHAALGVYDCDHWMGDKSGTGIWIWPGAVHNPDGSSSPGRVGTEVYAGLHSHDDGIIHMEPATADDAGPNATLGRYFQEGGWNLGADGFSFLGTTRRNGDKCDGKAAQLTWYVNGKQKTGNPAAYKLYDNDVIALAFAAGTPNVGAPPSIVNLPSRGESASTTPTTAVASAAGKPCVAENGVAPAAAPKVVVPVGPPPTKLVVRDLKAGTGATVNAGAKVTVDYIGVACSTGAIFDSSYSRGQPATFPLGGVIAGWREGLPGMRVGGVRLLGIPPGQAYGEQGAPPVIGPGETLWFVVSVKKIG